jgi:catechol 2,3-dioxygenase-like lactoylglutathione lyase family enzyme
MVSFDIDMVKEAGMSTNAEVGSTRPRVDMKLEVLVIPVSDIDRAKAFYAGLGWRADADIVVGDSFRIVQFTPPGSSCSVSFGLGVSSAAPGSSQGELIVSDIEAAHDELAGRGVDVSDVFHGSPFNPAGQISGPDPERGSYKSYLSFADPDGNRWLVQEVTARLPGRLDAVGTTFGSVSDLASALRRAEAAHGAHEGRTGVRDANWPDWYAAYTVAEQHGAELPR